MRNFLIVLRMIIGAAFIAASTLVYAQSPNLGAANSAAAAGLTGRPVTVSNLLSVLYGMNGNVYQPLGGSLSGSFPNPVIAPGAITAAMLAPGAIGGATVIVVPIRTATGAADTTSASDYVVCLNGPTQETLESKPPIGTTHVLKDCRVPGGSAISVLPSGGDTIDGGTSISFTNARQAMTVSYSSLGWEVY